MAIHEQATTCLMHTETQVLTPPPSSNQQRTVGTGPSHIKILLFTI